MISKEVALTHISKDREIFDHFRAFDNVWFFCSFLYLDMIMEWYC